MRWVNHQAVTGMAVYMLTGDFVYTACAMAGSVLPDRVEGKPWQAKNYWAWRKQHRGRSHWFAPYAMAAYVFWSIAFGPWKELALIGFFLMFGALCHLFEDALCGQIPLWGSRLRIGIRLFRVGSFAECVVSLILIALLYIAGMMGPFPYAFP